VASGTTATTGQGRRQSELIQLLFKYGLRGAVCEATRFRDAESFYATLAHESAHWTRHPRRLDRDFGRKHWADGG
jgi:hypothetical protein